MLLTSGWVEEPVDGDLVAVDDVEDAGGQAGLGPQLGGEVDRRRVLLARLDDDGVPRRDGDRVEPHGHHGREVERRDDADDAERLADRVDVDLRRDALGVAALEQVRDAAGELDDLEAARHLTERVGEDLAVLGGDERGHVLLLGVEQLAEGEEDLGALGEGGVPPLGEGLLGDGHRLVDVGRSREVDLAADEPGRGVVDVALPLGHAAVGLAADPVRDVVRAHGRLLGVRRRAGGAAVRAPRQSGATRPRPSSRTLSAPGPIP